MSPPSSPRPSRHIKVHNELGILILTVNEARLHGYSLANALRQEMITAVTDALAEAPNDPVRVVLNFQAVTSLTSEAFRPLLHLQRTVEEKNGKMVLCNLSPVVAQALRITRLIGPGRSSTGTFLVEPDVAAAIERLKNPDTWRSQAR